MNYALLWTQIVFIRILGNYLDLALALSESDQFVYELYDRTLNEIAIVEGAQKCEP